MTCLENTTLFHPVAFDFNYYQLSDAHKMKILEKKEFDKINRMNEKKKKWYRKMR